MNESDNGRECDRLDGGCNCDDDNGSDTDCDLR